MNKTEAIFNGETMTRREVLIARESYATALRSYGTAPAEAYRRAIAAYPLPTVTRPRVVRDPHDRELRWTVRGGEIALYDSDYVKCCTPSNYRVALWADLIANPNETVEE